MLLNPNKLPFPEWAEVREGWTYVGWIKYPPEYGSFDVMVERERKSDHGELRAVDVYHQGAVCWMKENEHAYSFE